MIASEVAAKLPIYSQAAAITGSVIMAGWCVVLLIALVVRSRRR